MKLFIYKIVAAIMYLIFLGTKCVGCDRLKVFNDPEWEYSMIKCTYEPNN